MREHPYKAFLHEPRQTETARPVSERLQDFAPVYEPPTSTVVKTQAQRCMGCGVPFCHTAHGCPLHNLIPDWNELVAKGRYEEALQSLHATNNFPEFTGQLCPAPCESACVLGLSADPVTIRQIELAIVNYGFEAGLIRPKPPRERREAKIAIVGSGPAGLAAAQELARKGYQVTVFEKEDRPGGLLRYGIPDFKMAKGTIDRRLRQMEAEGVQFVTGTALGQDVSLEELTKGHAAVGLAIGAENPRLLAVPGCDLGGIVLAMDFLTAQNRLVAGTAQTQPYSAAGRDVIIIGGGDTGSDCLGTVLRQGAKSVMQFELLPKPPQDRSETTPWPLWPMQLRKSHAHEEGGERLWSVATTGFSGTSGRVSQIHTVRVERQDGIFRPIPGTEAVMPADLVILAMGFGGIDPKVAATLGGVSLTPQGQIATTDQGMTTRPGVFAAGDARRGASLIVWAIAEGRRMATAMDLYLRSSPTHATCLK